MLETVLRDVHEPASGLPRPRRRAGSSCVRSAALLAVVALGGCGLSENAKTLLVDPSRYEGYHCKDLIGQWNGLLAQEKSLRSLMGKADDASGGAVIGAITYRTDYETVLAEKKVLQRTAAEKQCSLGPTYQSDQTVR